MDEEIWGAQAMTKQTEHDIQSTPEHIILMRMHLSELCLRFAEEYRFDPVRRWKFDFAVWPEGRRVGGKRAGVEIDGGLWTQGRHTRGKGYQADMDKLNAATAAGWHVFRFSVEDVKLARDIPLLRKWLVVSEWTLPRP